MNAAIEGYPCLSKFVIDRILKFCYKVTISFYLNLFAQICYQLSIFLKILYLTLMGMQICDISVY